MKDTVGLHIKFDMKLLTLYFLSPHGRVEGDGLISSRLFHQNPSHPHPSSRKNTIPDYIQTINDMTKVCFA